VGGRRLCPSRSRHRVKLRSFAMGSTSENLRPLSAVFGCDEQVKVSLSLFNHCHEWVEMYGINRGLQSSQSERETGGLFWHFGRGCRIQSTCESLDIRCELVVGAMDIFTNIHATRTNVWQHFLKRYSLLFGLMPSIIDQNVNGRHCFLHLRPESAIRLVSYE